MSVRFRELTLLWTRFSPLEERLLVEVRGVLPVAARTVFDAQLNGINHVQRLPPSWSEIDFYCLRRYRKPAWEKLPKFPCTDQFRLAEVTFDVKGKRYKATLSSIDGHLFDFAITPGPRSVAFERWDALVTAVLLADPLRAPTGRKEPESLPLQWREFLRDRAGDQPPGWILHDEGTAHRVSLDDGVYLILAEHEEPAFILHRVEPAGAHLFYLPHYDAQPEPLQAELREVIEGTRPTRAGERRDRPTGGTRR